MDKIINNLFFTDYLDINIQYMLLTTEFISLSKKDNQINEYNKVYSKKFNYLNNDVNKSYELNIFIIEASFLKIINLHQKNKYILIETMYEDNYSNMQSYYNSINDFINKCNFFIKNFNFTYFDNNMIDYYKDLGNHLIDLILKILYVLYTIKQITYLYYIKKNIQLNEVYLYLDFLIPFKQKYNEILNFLYKLVSLPFYNINIINLNITALTFLFKLLKSKNNELYKIYESNFTNYIINDQVEDQFQKIRRNEDIKKKKEEEKAKKVEVKKVEVKKGEVKKVEVKKGEVIKGGSNYHQKYLKYKLKYNLIKQKL